MAYNKIVYKGDTLIDLTQDTVTPETLAEGIIAHAKNGEVIVGTGISSGSGGAGGGENWIGDGNTHIWISLQENRTSPILGVCPKGTVTVDWGDGSEPDVLTGTKTSTVKYTPIHEYGKAGDYVITLTVDGEVGVKGDSLGTCLLCGTTARNYSNRVYANSIQKVELGDGVTSIGNQAFQDCRSLSSITIPDGVTSIGAGAFYYCYALSSITIPDSVTYIANNAFQKCYSLSNITIPDNVTSIGNKAFQDCCSLTSITIPDNVTSIGNSMFQNCYNLSSITIPDGVTSIGNYAFNCCHNLSSITIPNSVTSIGDQAFSNCHSLSNITIPDGVTSIGYQAFYNCHSLSNITIPDGVTSIGNTAFYECCSLTSITIPNSVTSIGNTAFQNCYGIAYYDFTKHTAVPTLSATNSFTGIPSDCEIRVPAALVDEWKAATNWSTYADKIVGV